MNANKATDWITWNNIWYRSNWCCNRQAEVWEIWQASWHPNRQDGPFSKAHHCTQIWRVQTNDLANVSSEQSACIRESRGNPAAKSKDQLPSGPRDTSLQHQKGTKGEAFLEYTDFTVKRGKDICFSTQEWIVTVVNQLRYFTSAEVCACGLGQIQCPLSTLAYVGIS